MTVPLLQKPRILAVKRTRGKTRVANEWNWVVFHGEGSCTFVKWEWAVRFALSYYSDQLPSFGESGKSHVSL